MLNYNKIYSDMNRVNIRLAELSRYCNIKYTSLKDRFEKEKLYAVEVEMIADYFGRPISYYFDQEGRGSSNYPTDESMNTAEETKGTEFSGDDAKQRKVEVLTKKLYAANEKLDKLNRKYTRLLERRLDGNDDQNT